MKITKEQLKQIIKEEIELVMNEQDLDEGLFDFLRGKEQGKSKETGTQKQKRTIVDIEDYKRMTPRERADVITKVGHERNGLQKIGNMIISLMGEKVDPTDRKEDPNALALEAFNFLPLNAQVTLKDNNPGAFNWTDSPQTKTKNLDRRVYGIK